MPDFTALRHIRNTIHTYQNDTSGQRKHATELDGTYSSTILILGVYCSVLVLTAMGYISNQLLSDQCLARSRGAARTLFGYAMHAPHMRKVCVAFFLEAERRVVCVFVCLLGILVCLLCTYVGFHFFGIHVPEFQNDQRGTSGRRTPLQLNLAVWAAPTLRYLVNIALPQSTFEFAAWRSVSNETQTRQCETSGQRTKTATGLGGVDRSTVVIPAAYCLFRNPCWIWLLSRRRFLDVHSCIKTQLFVPKWLRGRSGMGEMVFGSLVDGGGGGRMHAHMHARMHAQPWPCTDFERTDLEGLVCSYSCFIPFVFVRAYELGGPLICFYCVFVDSVLMCFCHMGVFVGCLVYKE